MDCDVIKDGMVVYLDCLVTDETEQVLDDSGVDGPMVYLHGAKNVVPGLERILEGKRAGDTYAVVIEPRDAYGAFDAGRITHVPKSEFHGVDRVERGMAFVTEDVEGPSRVFVLQVVGDIVTVDANHPLAGRTLTFSGKVLEVRRATEQELEEGRAC